MRIGEFNRWTGRHSRKRRIDLTKAFRNCCNRTTLGLMLTIFVFWISFFLTRTIPGSPGQPPIHVAKPDSEECKDEAIRHVGRPRSRKVRPARIRTDNAFVLICQFSGEKLVLFPSSRAEFRQSTLAKTWTYLPNHHLVVFQVIGAINHLNWTGYWYWSHRRSHDHDIYFYRSIFQLDCSVTCPFWYVSFLELDYVWFLAN